MLRYLAVLIVALAVVPAALAGFATGTGEHRLRVCERKFIATGPIPSRASVNVRVFANGRELQGFAANKHEVYWTGRGVVVLTRGRPGAARMQIRVANLREQCSRVRVIYRWTAS